MNFFNNLKVGKKIIAGYVVVLIMMTIMTAILLLTLNNLTKDFNFLVKHDQPVLSNAHKLTKLVIDMETGERGFLITGKDEFLEPYQNGLTKFEILLEIEKKLISDNPPQVAVLEKIEQLHDTWIEKAAKPEIAKRREANKASMSARQLQEILKMGVGKNILDNLRRVLEQLESNLRATNDLESIILTLKIAKNIVDQETGQRGFIITGEDNFLEPYRDGLSKMVVNITALHSRLTGDFDNLALLNQIELLITEWLEKAAKPEIEARQELNTNPITITDISNMIQIGTGKAILDEMRSQFDIFIHIENQLNAKRSGDAEQQVVLAHIISIFFTLGGIVFILLLSLFISRSITRPLTTLTKMANKMAVGEMRHNLNTQNLNQVINRQDEMGEIGRVYNTLVNYFSDVIEDIVQVSQGLAAGNLRVIPQADYKGDFAQIKNALETGLSDLHLVIEDIVQVSQGLAEGGQNVVAKAEYKGDFAQIKNALETTSTKLAEATTKNAIQDWLKTGQTQLSEQMSGEQDVITLANNIINFITTYLEAQVGVFYLLEEKEERENTLRDSVENACLKLIASYAYTQRKGTGTEFEIGESLIGQAALEKQRIIVTDIPEDYMSIQSGIGEAMPQQLLVMPFLYENTVKGVIEIGSFHKLTTVQLEWLDQVMPNLGIAVNSADSRTKMQELLQKRLK
ncbi:CHASE3 domain-containing protein [Candidatus Parabeggiatoa sp. HSG14]|uniref:CHASE3 domain-containing protein n=1 Tax=Candidatus Parabeggiatoa sp. HSG14 TaxID=3055593 RepID=UPI0025A7AA58|nr:CHASE3 domain-containing protein [Thiotrichales bacterium HSG14]